MSVIPLVTDGPNRTVVQTQQQFNVEANAVLIGNLELVQLNDEKTSNVSYDFRIGSQCRSLRETEPKELGAGDTITLNPGSAVIIQTEEFVHLPRSMFGIIAPKVSLLQQGLSTTFSKVDPGYNGRLLITLFNLGQIPRMLSKGQKFCAFTLITVQAGARLYDRGGKQLQAKVAQGLSDRIRETLEANHVAVTVMLITVEIVLIIATALLALTHLIELPINRR